MYQKNKKNPEVLVCVERGNYDLNVLVDTDHSAVHTELVAGRVKR